MAIDPRITDFGTHACQYSDDRAENAWNFLACIADDFRIDSANENTVNYRLTRMIAPFHFYQIDIEADPNVVEGMYVMVFEDNGGKPAFYPRPTDLDNLRNGIHPGGSIFDDGAVVVPLTDPVTDLPAGLSFHEGVVAMEWVPRDKFNSITSLESTDCISISGRPCNRWIYDFPINLIVDKNTNYWITAMPGSVAPPQTTWLVSNIVAAKPAMVMSSFENPNWQEFSGNDGYDGSTPGAFKNVSFEIYGKERFRSQ